MEIVNFMVIYIRKIYKIKCKNGESIKSKSDCYVIYFFFVFISLIVSNNGLTYLVGICVSPNNSSAAIIQKEGNSSIILGKLDDVNIVGEG